MLPVARGGRGLGRNSHLRVCASQLRLLTQNTTPGRLQQPAFILHSSGAWKPRSRCRQFLARACFPPAYRQPPFCCVLTWWEDRERERALIYLLLLQRHKPHREGPTFMSSSNLITSQSRVQMPSELGGGGGVGRASACEFRGTQFSPQQCSCRVGDWRCWGLETFSWTMPSSEPPTLSRYLK